VLIVAGSLLAGLVAAIALVLGPFAGDREAVITGAILLGFAIGWTLLAVLSTRFTDRPQRWAAVPAAAMALTGAGLIALAPGPRVLTALGWVWPPLLLALVVWMIVHARRALSGRAQRWLLYPVFGALTLAAVGGAYETLGNATDPGLAKLAGNRLIDVGGHRLSIRCTGTGSPTVVLEPGLGETASAMAHRIAPSVARTTTVCVYDQAGHGRSGAAPANAFAGTNRLLAVVPTLARMGLARLVADPKDGKRRRRPPSSSAMSTRCRPNKTARPS
jgi:hypothetical protein